MDAEKAKAAAKALGCRCDVEVKLTKISKGVFSASLFHDSWCPLLLSKKAGTN